MTDETITLDPVEFVPERTELGLDAMGIRVREAEWGDSEHELFMVRQALGEIPADRHPPNRTVEIKLAVEEMKAVTLAEAAQRLQQKIGLIQREGGFVRRDTDSSSGFEGPVATRVHAAALGGIHGWLMAHRRRAADVTLTLTTDPYFYGVSEIELAEVKAENARRLEYEIKEGKGSAPGLIRVAVKNEGTKKWFGLINSLESRDSSSASTAKMFYEAEALTLTGKAAKAARAGSSGEVVKSGSLSNTWVSILHSKIGANHMTHIGSRRILLRVFDPNTTALGAVKIRLEWRALGSNQWTQNNVVSAPVVGDFSIIDMGEVIPAQAVLGAQRWEWRLLAKTEGAIGQEVEVDCCYVLSTEQHMRIRENVTTTSGGGVIWEDPFEQSAGNMTGKTAPIGGVYTGAGDADDFTMDEANDRITRAAVSDTNTQNGRYLLSGAAESEEVNYSLRVRTFGLGAGTILGQVLRYKDTSNWLRVYLQQAVIVKGGFPIEGAYLKIDKCVAGVVTNLKTSEHISGGSWQRTIETIVKTDGSITASINLGKGSSIELSVTDEVFATGKTLAKGKVGIYDACTTGAAGTRYYEDPVAVAPLTGAEAVPDAVGFPGRGIELRSDGVYRQHETDDVWGRLVPDGFLPFFPAAGLEGRVARGILIPSSGDFASLADTGTNKLSAKVYYYPGYHFVSEAS